MIIRIIITFINLSTILFTTALVPERRIRFGDIARQSQFPYQGFLSYNHEIFCSVSIIHKRWCLTAASCVIDRPWPSVTVGTAPIYSSYAWNFTVDRFFRRIDFANSIPLQGLENDMSLYNVALIRLEKNIEFDLNIQPIRLDRTTSDYRGWDALIAGWGRNWPGRWNPPSPNLKYYKVKVATTQECKASYAYERYYVCTYTDKARLCDSDTGGPLTVNGVQIAVATNFSPDCVGQRLDGYLKVVNYVQWIKYILAMYNDVLCD